MPHYKEVRFLPYHPVHVYSVVADVEHYPDFLPWCYELKVYERKKNKLKAIMGLEVAGFKESFHSEVALIAPHRIEIRHLKEGPLKSLKSEWRFEPQKEGKEGCTVHFSIVFEFKNFLLNALLSGAMERITQKMVAAFEDRVHTLYKNDVKKPHSGA